MLKPTTVIIVDDHAMMRSLIARRLSDEFDMSVVECVADANAGVSMVARYMPNIVLMDIDMPGRSCFDAAAEMVRLSPLTRVVFLSAFCHDRYVEQAVRVRAWGYVTKSEPEETVVKAVREVASGTAYFSPDVRARFVVDRNGAKLVAERHVRGSDLTHRELEILRHIAMGMSRKQTAHAMHISSHTVANHTAHIMNKLGLRDRVELARYAIREGIVST